MKKTARAPSRPSARGRTNPRRLSGRGFKTVLVVLLALGASLSLSAFAISRAETTKANTSLHVAKQTDSSSDGATAITRTADAQPARIATPTTPHADVGDPPKKETRTPPRFVHPCIPTTREDLDFIKANLNKEPWKTGYAALVGGRRSQLTYVMGGPFAEVKRNPNMNLWPWRGDMIAVYNFARLWYFTGNAAYAQKGRDILIAWANTHKKFGGQESGLDLGDYAVCYAGGASILRGTWPGWTAADTAAVKNYFATVLWPATAAGINVAGPANKGSLNMAAGIAIAAFCDDVDRFNHVIDVFRTYPGSGLPNTLPTGQMGETGRDAGHSYGDLLSRAFVAEVAWKQGIDLYSELDNRLLACGEYYARNTMASDLPTAPFVPFGTVDYHYWVNQNGPYTANRGGLYLIQNAYKNRKNLPTPWIDRKLEEQHVDDGNFMFAKTADSIAATLLPPIVYPSVSPASGGLALTTLGPQTAGRGATYSQGIWTVTGLGNGGWNDAGDDCQFVQKQMNGDCAMVAQVTSLTASDSGNRKAGLLIRDALTANATQRGWVAITPTTPKRFECYMSGWSETWGGRNWAKRSQALDPNLPYWLKIERRGKLISTFASQDGTSWSPVCSSYYANLPASLYVGLFVSSGTKELATATFANVAFTGGTGGLVKKPAAPATVFAVGAHKDVTVRWLPSFGATSYDVLRSTVSGSGYTVLAENLGTAKTSYVDTTVSAGTTYYYVVRSKNAVGVSGNSPQFSAALLSPLIVNLVGNGTATASANGASEWEGPQKAFDRNPGSRWVCPKSSTGWVQYDFGAGRAQIVKRYSITGTDVIERAPTSWTLQASQDGTTWTTLDTQKEQKFPYRMRMNTYDIRNTAAYRFYRLDITANQGAPDTAVGELGLWSDGGAGTR